MSRRVQIPRNHLKSKQECNASCSALCFYHTTETQQRRRQTWTHDLTGNPHPGQYGAQIHTTEILFQNTSFLQK